MKKTTYLALAAIAALSIPTAPAEARDDGPHFVTADARAEQLVGSRPELVTAAAFHAPNGAQLLLSQAPDAVDHQVDEVLRTVPAPPAGSPWAIVFAVLTLALPFAMNAYRMWRKDKAETELNAVYTIARTVFLLTEEAKRLFPGKVPDAALYAEAKFIELFRAQIGKDPSPAQLAIATSQFKAAHGATKLQEDLADRSGPMVIGGAAASPQ